MQNRCRFILWKSLNFIDDPAMFVSACEARGSTLWILGWWCVTQNSDIAYNREYLARTRL